MLFIDFIVVTHFLLLRFHILSQFRLTVTHDGWSHLRKNSNSILINFSELLLNENKTNISLSILNSVVHFMFWDLLLFPCIYIYINIQVCCWDIFCLSTSQVFSSNGFNLLSWLFSIGGVVQFLVHFYPEKKRKRAIRCLVSKGWKNFCFRVEISFQ